MAQSRAVHQKVVPLQGPIIQRNPNSHAVQLPPNLSNFGGGGGQPLPSPVRQKMESFFGTSFADVRVHVGTQASSIGALAFTQGSNLFFAQGQYNPNTPRGQQILGHELTHVVQQRAGRVRNPFGSGVAVVQDRSMEAEADRMGSRAAAQAVQTKPVAPFTRPLSGSSATAGASAQLHRNTLQMNGDKNPFVGEDESLDEIKSDVDSAMAKIKHEFTNGAFQHEQLDVQGRDQPVYAFFAYCWNTKLGALIRGWSATAWSLEATAGLMLDLGSNMKNVESFLSLYEAKKEKWNILSKDQRRVRDKGKKFTEPEHEWARSIDESFEVNAGPSATTATLLKFLSVIPSITLIEREAIMQAVILYWRGTIKRKMGDYHTGVEVWMAYTRRLEKEMKAKKQLVLEL